MGGLKFPTGVQISIPSSRRRHHAAEHGRPRVVRALLAAGATVRAHDPESMPVARTMVGEGVEFCDDPYAAIEGADALAIVTEWKAFRSPDFARIKSALAEPVIFDGRNLYDPAVVSAAGLEYHAIGRPVAKAKK